MRTEPTAIRPCVWRRWGMLMVCGIVLGAGSPLFSSENISPSKLASTLSHVRSVNLSAEISAPMFRGTVHTVDRESLRITMHTDFGRFVILPIGSCDIIALLRIGDHVSLNVDAQGIVRAVEKTATLVTPPSNSPQAARPPDSCPESRT